MGFPVVSSRLFHTWAKGVSQPLQAPLSMSRYLAQQMRDLPTNVHRLPMKKYLEIVKLMETEYQHVFAESDRVHLLQIVFLLSLQTEDKSSKFHAILHWFSRTKIELGDSVFLLISNPVSYEKNASLQPVIQMMHYLLGMAPFIDKLMPSLIKFYKKEIGLAELNKSIIQMKREIERAKFDEKKLDEVLEGFRVDSDDVKFHLKSEALKQIEKEYLEIEKIGLTLQDCDLETLAIRAQEIRHKSKGSITLEDKLMLLALGREAIRIYFGIYPYNTQVLTVLGLLSTDPKLKGSIAQVKTGEGKSTIVTLMTFYFACQGKMVDVISSTRTLAKRDQKKYASFFRVFGITTSHICYDHPSPDCFRAQILYGVNHNFEFAIMWDSLLNTKLRMIESEGRVVKRPFDVVIVDEVDNLLIDSANQSARIAIPGKTQLSWIYPYIMKFITDHVPILIMLQLGDEEAIKFVVQDLRVYLKSIQGGKFAAQVDKLADRKMEIWLRSALKALYHLQENVDYVIKPKKDIENGKKVIRKMVIPIDRNTGSLQEGTRWSNGIHEFIESKHDLVVKEESLTIASFCHSVFFSFYSNIYGLTGTMGPEVERMEVKEVYQVGSFDVPPHRKSLKKMMKTVVASDEASLVKALISDIEDMQKVGRSTLILCDSIEETIDYDKILDRAGLHHFVLNERQQEDAEYIIAKAGEPKAITIATNTAGRGTDIILSPSVLEKGGLHVIFIYHALSERVEIQGLGRAGRQGQPGSGRIILKSSKSLEQLKQDRERQIVSLSKQRKNRSILERQQYKDYLKHFFLQCESWHSAIDDQFLKSLSEVMQSAMSETSIEGIKLKYVNLHTRDLELCTLVLKLKKRENSIKEYPANFSSNEVELCDQFLHQLKETNSNLSWLPFLEKVKRTLIDKIQFDWSHFFYHRLDDLPTDQNQYQKESAQLFEKTKGLWMPYFTEPRDGFNKYVMFLVSFFNYL